MARTDYAFPFRVDPVSGQAAQAGYAAHVERAIDLIGELKGALASRGWRIANDSTLAVLCVEPPDGSCDVPTLASRVLASGRAWVGVASFQGRKVIRICVTHGEAGTADVRELIDVLEASKSSAL